MLAEVLIKIASEQGKEEGHAAYRPRPSSAGPDRCIRAMTYHAMGTPRAPLPGRAILVFDDSSWHEELSADWINKSAYRLHSRQMGLTLPGLFPWLAGKKHCSICGQDYDGADLHGHIDGVITDVLGVDRLWEHKAINHFTFERMWKGDFPADYFAQCAIYIKGLQRVNPRINEALLLVKNKNTAQYLEFLLHYDGDADTIRIVEMVRSDGEHQTPAYEYPGILADVVDKFTEVERQRAAGTLPPRPYEFGSEFPCSYCPWNRPCWENFAAELSALPDSADLSALIEKVERYQIVKGDEAKAREEKDSLREEILGELARLNAKGGRAGQFIVQAKMKKRAATKPDPTAPPVEFIQLEVSVPKESKNGK